MAKKKPAPKKKKVVKRKVVKRKPASKKRPVAKKRPAPRKKPVRRKRAAAGAKQEITNPVARSSRRGLGAASGGQSGDTQGLSRVEDADSESVEELLEEGQYFEAEAVSGVENAKDPDEGEVTTSELPRMIFSPSTPTATKSRRRAKILRPPWSS